MDAMISVIIPLYNSERTIGNCLDSILEQNYENYEIILIDDGSTDNSKDIIANYINLNADKIKYYYQENSGPGKARNIGLDVASGEYIIFVDSDDTVDNKYFYTVNKLFSNYDVNVIQFGYKKISKDMDLITENVASKEKIIRENHIIVKKYGSSDEIDIFLSSKAFRRKSLKKFRFERYYYAEDQLFLTEYFYNQDKILIYNEVFYNYIMSQDSLVRTPFSVLKLDGINAAQSMYEMHCYYYPENKYIASNKLCFYISTMYLFSNKGEFSKKALKKLFNEHYNQLKAIQHNVNYLDRKKLAFYKFFYYLPNVASALYNLFFILKMEGI